MLRNCRSCRRCGEGRRFEISDLRFERWRAQGSKTMAKRARQVVSREAIEASVPELAAPPAMDAAAEPIAAAAVEPVVVRAEVAKNKTECPRCHGFGCPSYGKHLTMAGVMVYRRCVACGWRFSVLTPHGAAGEHLHQHPPATADLQQTSVASVATDTTEKPTP